MHIVNVSEPQMAEGGDAASRGQVLEYPAAASLEPNFIVLPPDMTLIHHSKAAALVFSHLDADVASVSPCV